MNFAANASINTVSNVGGSRRNNEKCSKTSMSMVDNDIKRVTGLLSPKTDRLSQNSFSKKHTVGNSITQPLTSNSSTVALLNSQQQKVVKMNFRE